MQAHSSMHNLKIKKFIFKQTVGAWQAYSVDKTDTDNPYLACQGVEKRL